MRNQGVGTHTQEVCRVGTVTENPCKVRAQSSSQQGALLDIPCAIPVGGTYAEIKFGVAYGSRLLQCMTMRYRSSLEQE